MQGPSSLDDHQVYDSNSELMSSEHLLPLSLISFIVNLHNVILNNAHVQ